MSPHPAHDPALHWFLPTGGDDRTLHPGGHGGGIGADGATPPAGRPATLAYLTQIAQAADDLGFDGVLTPTGAHCQDAWLTTAALIAATRRLHFLVALRPGLVAPVLAAQMAGTFQRLSSGRLMLNVVAGSSAAEQRGYGDFLDHDQRYARAAEFLGVLRTAARGVPFDHAGEHYTVEGGALREPVDPFPPVYLGGSSAAAIEVAAQHADAYLTWGEPVDAVAAKIERVRSAADAAGRKLRFGLRVHVITREDASRAWADAESLIAGLDKETVRRRQAQLSTLDSEGQQRMLALHGGDPDRLVVGPNLWAGIGLIRGGAGTALVGSHDEVAERLREYQQAGIDEFILSGYPHLEEAYAFAEGVLPRFR